MRGKDLNFKIDPELHQAFKTTAARRGVSMTALFEACFGCWSEIHAADATDTYLPPKWRASEGWQDLTLKVDPELHRAFKITAVGRGVSMTALFEVCFRWWLEIHGDDAIDAF